jgi:hypothetical protein
MKKVLLLLFAIFFLILPHEVYAQVHERPVTSSALSPDPTSPGSGLSFYSDPVTVTLTATADVGYTATTYYKIDGQSQQTYTSPFTVSGVGKHQVEFWSIDNSGIEELTHKFTYFTISYQHGLINYMTQNGNNMDIGIHIDNIQPYLNYINSVNGGGSCWNDNGVNFEIYDAVTKARLSSYSGQGAFHCGNLGTPSDGNQWLAFPPLQLPTGTYFIHYSGGSFDWITEDFSYTAPVPVHATPNSTSSLSPSPTSPGSGLSFYSDPVTVTLSATADTGFSIANIYYKIDGGAQQTYSEPFTVSGVGKHQVEYWSVDNTNLEEATHRYTYFTIGYQHGVINYMTQNGNNMDIGIHIDNIQPYLSYINSVNGGGSCWNDNGVNFEIYDAVTKARLSSYSGQGAFHCGNLGDPSEGNQWLAFPPLQLPTGTYFIHYSGGSFDWITEDFSYTAPVPVHATPNTTSSLAPSPTIISDLTFYSDPVTVTLTATADTGYNIANTYYKVDGGSQQTYSGPITVSGVGKHQVEYWSIDNTGLEESAHRYVYFTIGYQHGLINYIEQNSISIDIGIHIDNIQPYLNYINSVNGGGSCWNDNGVNFALYNATTGAKVSSFSGQGAFHCGNLGDPSEGNQWLGFPPLLLPVGTYFLHYSGGNFDWITEPFDYHPTPKTTVTLETQNEDETYSNPTTVTLSATSAIGTVLANTYYKVDGNTQQTYGTPFTVSGGGEHTIEYWSVDNTGVEETHKVKDFTIYLNQAPYVDPLSDVEMTEGQTYTATGSFTDSDSTSWTATVDYDEGAGEEPLTLNPDKTFNLNHQYNTEGEYTVTVVVHDDSQATGMTSATVTVIQPDPVTVTFNATGDTHVRSGQGNHNYGGASFMRIQSSGDNRGLVHFDQAVLQSSISGTVLSAKLRFTITDNGNNWGATGRTVDVHRVISSWVEGNGTESSNGTGSGATWNCAIDGIISNSTKNCSGITEWEMGQPNNPSVHPWVQAATDSETITNGQSGVVEYDVTSDVEAFMSGTSNYGWLVKKTNEGQNGQVSFGTRESASVPQLIVTYQP